MEALGQANAGFALPSRALSLVSRFLAPAADAHPPLSKSSREVENNAQAQPGACALIFSKNRPGQLYACLSSAFANVKGVDEWYVVYSSSNAESDSQYRYAFARLKVLASDWAKVHLLREDNSSSFAQALRAAFRKCRHRHVWFQVDDAVHYASLDLTKGMELLSRREDVLCLHSKLWPGIRMCEAGPTPRDMVQPTLTVDSCSNLLLFQRNSGTLDWNYAFDLSGGIYRLRDVVEILAQATDDQLSSPNVFELTGNQHFVGMDVTRPLSACLSAPALSLLSLNRVQSIFTSSKVFESRFKRSEPWGELTDEIFGRGLDLDAYRAAAGQVASVHIGDVRLLEPGIAQSVDASVLIPCRDAETTIAKAISSVLGQELGPFNIEIVVVDDSSADASACIVCKFQDNRIRLLRRPKSIGGVAGCLDFGLAHCRGEFIIRMDADDEMLPGRILAQLEFMRANPGVGVIGCQTIIRSSSMQVSNEQKLALCPMGCALVAWSLCFYCPLVHPAVCIRRSTLKSAGGFQSDVRAEDYALWHRIAANGWLLDNLSMKGLILVKHAASVTAKWTREAMDAETCKLAMQTLKLRAIQPSVDEEEWSILLRGPSTRLELATVSRLCQVLDALRDSIVDEFEHMAPKTDLDQVKRDCEARKAELNAAALRA